MPNDALSPPPHDPPLLFPCPARAMPPTHPGGQQEEGLADAAEGRHIHGLAAHHTGGAHAGGVFAGAGVDDGLDEHLDGVAVGHQVDDLERVADDVEGLDLLAGVAAVEHQHVHQALDQGALRRRVGRRG